MGRMPSWRYLSVTNIIFILLLNVPTIIGYGSGPLVGDSRVCEHMTPTGHGATMQPLSNSPFEIITNTDGCFKEGLKIQVVARTAKGKSDEMEGIFLQAREVGTSSPKGTFAVSNGELSTLKCGVDNNSVGQNRETHSKFFEMDWTPEAGSRSDIRIRATIVKKKKIFWVGLESAALKYDAGCVTRNKIRPGEFSGNGAISHGSSVLTPLILLLLTKTFLQ